MGKGLIKHSIAVTLIKFIYTINKYIHNQELTPSNILTAKSKFLLVKCTLISGELFVAKLLNK